MDVHAPELADFARYRVEPGEHFSITEHDAADLDSYDDRDEVVTQFDGLVTQIADFQERLYAEEKRSLLLVLQGIDAAGKDGTVKHVLRGTNPSGVRVYSFRQPTSEEAAHDFLWRYHQATPAKGMIHVFNRSHYEDVLVVRVKDLAHEHALEVVDRVVARAPAGEVPRAPGAAPQVLEVVGQRHQGARALGRVPAGLRGRDQRDEHAMGPVVRRPRRPPLVPQLRRRARARRHAGGDEPAVPGAAGRGQGLRGARARRGALSARHRQRAASVHSPSAGGEVARRQRAASVRSSRNASASSARS